MKKCLLFTIFLLKLAYNVHGNTVSYHEVNSAKTDSVKLIVKDSIRYLRDSIIANKEKFLHKEMNALLKELRIPAKSYIFISGNKILGPCEGIHLYFDDNVVVANRTKILPNLIITFDADISHRTAMLLFLKNFGQWDDGALAQYGPMLIKDIRQIH